MTVLAGAAQNNKKPPAFSFLTIGFLHFLQRVQKHATATNQKVGGSNPFWRTTFLVGTSDFFGNRLFFCFGALGENMVPTKFWMFSVGGLIAICLTADS